MRENARTRSPSRWQMKRKPSCLISYCGISARLPFMDQTALLLILPPSTRQVRLLASFAAVLPILCDAPVLHRSAHPFELQAMAIGTHCCGLLVGITEFDRKLLATGFCTGNVPNGRRKGMA